MADKYSLEVTSFEDHRGHANHIAGLDDGRFIEKGGYIIAKNGKAVYITNFPIFDIFKLTETEIIKSLFY